MLVSINLGEAIVLESWANIDTKLQSYLQILNKGESTCKWPTQLLQQECFMLSSILA
jgi:hypothetical protein